MIVINPTRSTIPKHIALNRAMQEMPSSVLGNSADALEEMSDFKFQLDLGFVRQPSGGSVAPKSASTRPKQTGIETDLTTEIQNYDQAETVGYTLMKEQGDV